MRTDNARAVRHKKLLDLIGSNPLLTDQELASSLGVSVSTVRLDRGLLSVPEVRERARLMAEKATSRLRSLKTEDVVGELLELEPNKGALSVLVGTRDLSFRHTDIISDYYIYTQASTLAVSAIDCESVVIKGARIFYKEPVRIGERVVARAKVGVHKNGEYVVSVHASVEGKEIFTGRFVAVGCSGTEKAQAGGLKK